MLRGSWSITHGDAQGKETPEYQTWKSMKNRCLNKNNKDYTRYGGRGITIDPAWMQYKNFLADMGRRPSPKHTLDRVHNNGAYTKANCRWATRLTQSCNRPAYNRLTKTLVDQIRLLYSQGYTTHAKLAAQFGVTETHIQYIIHRKVWK